MATTPVACRAACDFCTFDDSGLDEAAWGISPSVGDVDAGVGIESVPGAAKNPAKLFERALKQRHLPVITALAIFAALQVVIWLRVLHYSGGALVYALDDPYIEMAIGKNLALHGVWGVTSDTFSGASSSLIWPVLLAVLDASFGVRDEWPLILNLIAALAFIVLIARIGSHAGWDGIPLSAFLVAVLLATSSFALTVIGMEHNLQCLVAVALAYAASRELSGGRVPSGILECLVFTATGTRYDCLSVVAAVVAVLAWNRRWLKAATVLASAAVPIVLYGVFAAAHQWPPVPTSVLTKARVDAFESVGGAALFAVDGVALLFGQPLIAASIAFLLAATILTRSAHSDFARLARLMSVIAVLTGVLHAQFGRMAWPHRYEAYVVALCFVAAGLMFRLAASEGSLRVHRLVLVATLGVMFAGLAQHARHMGIAAILGARANAGHAVLLGRFFSEFPPSGAIVLNDLGAIPYYSDARVVDALGLGTLEMFDRSGVVNRDRLADAARFARAAIAVDTDELRPSWIEVGGLTTADVAPTVPDWLLAVDADAADKLRMNMLAYAARHQHRGIRFLATPGSRN